MSQDVLERIQPPYLKLVQALSSAVAAFYGERLISLVLYGSAARGCMRTDSDLDFVVVAEDLPRGSVARTEAFDGRRDTSPARASSPSTRSLTWTWRAGQRRWPRS